MKLSIVTPSYNSARFIRQSIESVLTQSGDFSIEYLILDNCSTDGTKEIVESYQARLHAGEIPVQCNNIEIKFFSQKDKGMYDAINNGFEKASGDIFAWINADDIYLPGAFASIAKAFRTYPEVQWLKGITSYITTDSVMWKSGTCWPYVRDWIKLGVYGRELYFIQQDSVFWRSELWRKVKKIDTSYKRAGDYYLWLKFAEFAELVSINTKISCFRKVEGQLSEDLTAYQTEMKKIAPAPSQIRNKFRLFSKLQKQLPAPLKSWFYHLIFGRKSFFLIQENSKGEMVKSSEDAFTFSKVFYE